ncbi:helix-turn-helix domain-containing protein [Maricaulis sp.]|uniref:helix-turn-helix domain-containing protein n=1 Tax=Maricaulis sp. TaxID=1486257 RepID=UPI003A8FF3F8
MNETVTLALATATLGQVALCTTILAMRSAQWPGYWALATFFIAMGIVSAGPLVSAFLPALESRYFSITIPAYLLMGPALYLYVEALTSERVWRPNRREARHLIPFGFGLAAMVLANSLPASERHEIFVVGETSGALFPAVVVIFIFALVLGWMIQSAYYVVRILSRLTSYRRRLRMLFASTENSELRWVGGLLLIMGTTWLLSFVSLVFDNFTGRSFAGPQTAALMSLVLVWSLASWGLRQKPGFEGRYLDDETDETAAPSPISGSDAKYTRSALTPEQAGRIAAKIEAAMVRDQIYLDPTISLPVLARHIGAPTNHISQTLNETIGECFFDYINKWRIRAAEPRISAGSETILEVAMSVGFNARSSFYKAFKRETGQTPSEYRRSKSEA